MTIITFTLYKTKGISFWNHATKAKNVVPLWFLEKYMMVKCWQQKMKGVLHYMTRSLKDHINKVLTENLWEEMCEVIISECSHLAGPEKCWKGKQCCFNINKNRHININLLWNMKMFTIMK